MLIHTDKLPYMNSLTVQVLLCLRRVVELTLTSTAAAFTAESNWIIM